MKRITNQPYSFDVSNYPPLPRLKGLFVTGTDTDVGKTVVAGAIARNLRNRGRRVEVLKAAATGCRRTREGLVSGDAEFLAACADSDRTLDEIAPLRYAAALSPNVAAAREHKEVDLEALFDSYRRMAAGGCEFAVVEGVGGLLCPISDDFWVIHFAKLTRLPLVIVARAGLGTINHTLLTIHAARSAGVSVAGVVINRYRLEGDPTAKPTAAQPKLKGDEDLAIFTNPVQIVERGKVRLLAIVPDEQENSPDKSTLGPDTQFAIDQVNWEEIAESQ